MDFNRLKMFRRQSGYTQEEIAEKLGVSRQAVAKWERGDTSPDIESCIKLADIYQTTVDLLVRSIEGENHSQDGKHIFGLAKINSKGQITLPSSCRKTFDLKEGDHLLILGDENRGMALIKMGSFMDGLADLGDKVKSRIKGKK